MKVGTFSAKYVETIIEVAAQCGASKAALWDCIDVNEDFFSSPNNRLCSLKTVMLFHEAIKLCGDPLIGLRVGQAFKPGTFDVLGYAVMCSETLYDAIQLNHRYQKLNQELGQTPLYLEGDVAVLEWHSCFEDQSLIRPVNEAVMSGYIGIGRWITWGDQYPVIKVEFKHERPERSELYEDIFGCPIDFNAKRTALHFHSEILNTPLQQSDPTIVELMKFQLDNRLKLFQESESVKSQVSCYIQSQLGKKVPTLSEAATFLGFHERTLRRRLQDEKTSFKQILDEIRRTSATAYLKRVDMSLIDVALLLGYQDQSTFTRAFRSWFDEPPGKYRERVVGV
ncbi:AraC family transcriptional regulator [Pleionea sediminis]|uniref:AraC family transcriptional regulator n=1 Tax=Pleionea sediminis TaxID=2569479 RepID=UPI001184EC36|nr:AraC family transcriptional regulator [Pleionea sediminis]